jgi:AP-3 complex subunit sigma
MIHSVLIFNNDGVPRLLRCYTGLAVHQQQTLLKQVHTLVRQRQDQNSSSFLSVPPLLQQTYAHGARDIRIVYRHYATLYFVFVVDQNESELGILDLIQVFVQVLNRCFKDVCELDLVFHWQVLQIALEETVQAGTVIDTNIENIMAAIDAMNREDSLGISSNGGSSGSGVGVGGVGVGVGVGGAGSSAATTAAAAMAAARSSFFSRWPLT